MLTSLGHSLPTQGGLANAANQSFGFQYTAANQLKQRTSSNTLYDWRHGPAATVNNTPNGLRVLGRMGYGRLQKNYGATYRSVQEALAGQLPPEAAALTRAHLLLRQHGKTLCRNNNPLCGECPVAQECVFAGKQV